MRKEKKIKTFLASQKYLFKIRLQLILFYAQILVLAQKQRLKGKDVLFLTRKRQYFGAGLFGFFYRKQYANLDFHQISFHVTIKYSKRSVQRHIIKRAVIDYIQSNTLTKMPCNKDYYKFFIVMNKNKLEEFTQKIANLPKKDIIILVQKEFIYARKKLNIKLGSPEK